MSYTDKEKIEAQLGTSLSSSQETALPYLLGWIDATINSLLGGSYGQVDPSVRTYEGGYQTLAIDPVSNVTSVTIVDDEGDITHTYELTDYILEPINSETKTYIRKRYGVFPCGNVNIQIAGDFTLGDNAPDDIVYVATYMACKLFTIETAGNIEEESIEGYRRKYAVISWSADPIVSESFGRLQATDILL